MPMGPSECTSERLRPGDEGWLEVSGGGDHEDDMAAHLSTLCRKDTTDICDL